MTKFVSKGGREVTLGVGVDIGTMNLVSARRYKDGMDTTRIRDAFLDLPKSARKMLKMSGVSYIPREDDVIVVGDAALEIASIFNQEARRPLSQGLISASEGDSLDILGVLVKGVLGEPTEPGEVCYFSVPAAPVDADRDVVYHTGVFTQIVEECGYTAYPSNEAMAIIYSQTAKEAFSGIAISFGSGMTNIALSVSAMPGLEFSVARGGDWIDAGAAKSVGMTQARICSLKEQGVDLLDPKGREQQAITHYYRSLIDHVLKHFVQQFQEKCRLAIPRAIPIVVSGGTSLAGHFMELFEERFDRLKKKFPVEVSEIRQAQDPLNAVAQGMLVQALQEYDDED